MASSCGERGRANATRPNRGQSAITAGIPEHLRLFQTGGLRPGSESLKSPGESGCQPPQNCGFGLPNGLEAEVCPAFSSRAPQDPHQNQIEQTGCKSPDTTNVPRRFPHVSQGSGAHNRTCPTKKRVSRGAGFSRFPSACRQGRRIASSGGPC